MHSATDKKGKRPLYIPVLLLLTVVYLLVECAFNAQLLDIVGMQATLEQIEHIEFYGRIISGVALALAVCGTVVFPWLHKRGGGLTDYVKLAVLCSVPLVLLVFHGEKMLIDTLSQRSTEKERKIAAHLSLAANQLKQGELLVQGINLDGAALRSPEGKAFLSLFSPLVAHLPDAERILNREMDSLIRQVVTHQLGTAEDFYHGPFKDSFVPLQEKFRVYAAAMGESRKTLTATPAEGEKLWANYAKALKENRYTPGTVPGRHHPRVRTQVQRMGIPVRNDWKPHDKQRFLSAYAHKVQTEHDETMRQFLVSHTLPENFSMRHASFDAFLGDSFIQSSWKERLGMPKNVRLTSDMKVKEFEANAFIPLREKLIAEKKDILLSNAKNFANGGNYEALGTATYRERIVPPIALLFSLLGALIHLCKTSFYALRLCLPFPRCIALANGLLFSVLLVIPLYATNSITRTDVYEYVDGEIGKAHPVTAKSLRWVIQAQSFAYPVNAWVRDTLLQGVRFGAGQDKGGQAHG